jgi:mono/diheme cytochrome c family protein
MRDWLFALALSSLLVACGKNEKPPKPLEGPGQQEQGPTAAKPASPTTTPPPSGMPSEAQVLFANVCAQCHGVDGTGTGPAAASLNPKPRNYTDPAWQASVTDDEIKKIIVGGGQAVGKSGMMPPNPNLKDREDVLNELVAIIRGFGKPK